MGTLRLIWFDLTRGLPIAVATLIAELGWLGTAKVLPRFMWRKSTGRYFEAVGPATSAGDRFTRHQLLPVLVLDDVLHKDLGLSQERGLTVLERVVAQSGAAFIGSNLKPPDKALWMGWTPSERSGFAERVLSNFLNADAKLVDDPTAELGFDVSFCHFASLTRKLDRGHLAPLFCAADSAYFGRPDAPIQLRRDETIASGGDTCRFRFHFTDDPEA